MKGHGCLEHYGDFYFTRILLHFADSLQIILAFLGDHCGVGTGLQLILTWLNVLVYYERIPKKQDGSLVGRTPSFSLVILITSNSSFSTLFASITSAPPP